MDFVTMKSVNKSFGGVNALVDVSFSVKKGEIRGLLGENGSGKSTLMKILAGSLAADTGEIKIDSKEIKNYGALSGLQYGISVIYQDLSLFPNLSVVENICLCNQIINKQTFFSVKTNISKVKRILNQLDSSIDMDMLVEELPIAQQQMVAIARALFNDSKLLIFDEPTTALTREEINKLFSIINNLKKEGLTFVFISHKLDEIMEICDSLTILRDGEIVETQEIENYTIDKIEKLMVGESSLYAKDTTEFLADEADEILSVKNICKKNNFHNISFTLKKGEVLGITGLLGSGRTELASALYGIAPVDSGIIVINDKTVSIKCVNDAVKEGIALVPEDRLRQGLIMDYSQSDNIMASALKKYSKNYILDEVKLRQVSQEWVTSLTVKTDDQMKTARTLSGGNQQKIVVGKCLEMNPQILILDGPTVGVDIKAKAGIFKIIKDMMKKTGMSVILISDEIKEIATYSNRVLIMHQGRVIQELKKAEEISEEYIYAFFEKHSKR